jgi:hypothetical protein
LYPAKSTSYAATLNGFRMQINVADVNSLFGSRGSSIWLAPSQPILFYALWLPVHWIRLYQMLELVKDGSRRGPDRSVHELLRPYMRKQKYRAGG